MRESVQQAVFCELNDDLDLLSCDSLEAIEENFDAVSAADVVPEVLYRNPGALEAGRPAHAGWIDRDNLRTLIGRWNKLFIDYLCCMCLELLHTGIVAASGQTCPKSEQRSLPGLSKSVPKLLILLKRASEVHGHTRALFTTNVNGRTS